jgi:hypothetical protein
MTRRLPAAAAALLALVVSAPPTSAQGWAVDAYAGRAVYDAVAASIGTSNGVLGIRYNGAGGSWLYVTAAAPLAAGNPAWGALGLGHRLMAGRKGFGAGLDIGAHGYGYRDPSTVDFGAGATVHALPFLAAVRGPARLEIRSGVLQHLSTLAGQSHSRAVHDSGVRLAVGGSSPLELSGEGRYVRAEEGGYSYGGAMVSLDHGRGEIWVSAGRWFSEAIPDLAWGTGATVKLGTAYDLWASVRHDPAHPLYWNDARQSWNVGVSRRLGSVGQRAAWPRPPEVTAGRVTIQIPASASSSEVFVAGDFNGWKAVAMERLGEYWTISLAVEPGHYHYAFRTGDGNWFVPESLPGRRADGFGGHVAVLVVP